MKIAYRLTLEDYYEASKARQRNERKTRQRWAILGAAVSFAVFVGTRTNNFLALALVLLVAVPFTEWMDKWSFRRSYRRAEAMGPNRTFNVEISEEGIQDLAAGRLDKWSQFSKYSESESVFILYEAKSICTILPKRAFDPNDATKFRQLLSTNLARH